jgi:acyl-CoA hydrolase
MNFHTRKWVKPEDLNPNGTLFGGSLLRWIDEEAAIYAIVQLGNQRVVTKYISEINFVSASRQGDIIELGITATEFGRTSITLKCEVRNKITRKASSRSTRWSSSTWVKTACRPPMGAPRSSTCRTSSRTARGVELILWAASRTNPCARRAPLR